MSLREEMLRAGHEVIGVTPSTGAALLLARAEQPELALVDLDLRLTDDGIRLARTLRMMDIPTIVLSDDKDRIAEASQCAVMGIFKPFSLDDIPIAIELAFRLGSDGNEASSPLPSSITLFGTTHHRDRPW
jgi:DNA-binding response OmpR family regulator